MFSVPRLRAIIVTLLLASSLFSPAVSSAQAQEFDGIPFENPSSVRDATATPVASPEASPVSPPTTEMHGAFLGDADAPVTMQIYADYQCPHCRNFHNTIEPLLIDDYVRSDKVRLEFIDFPVIGIGSLNELTDDSKESVQAAEATMCAGEQDAYMEYRETLYTGDLQPNTGVLSDENLVATAADLGLDSDALANCLASGRYEEPVIRGMLSGIDKGVQGTPTMMIDGEILQAADYGALQNLLDEAIENAR